MKKENKKVLKPTSRDRQKILGTLKESIFQVKCGPCADSCTSGERCK